MRDASKRVRDRLIEWTVREGHGSKKRLGEAVSRLYSTDEHPSQSWVTGILKGDTSLSLKDLDAVADLLGQPPGEMVRKDGTNYRELTMAESRLVDYYRSLPEMVRHNWLAFLDYLFRFQQEALLRQGQERAERTAKARRRESKHARLKTGSKG